MVSVSKGEYRYGFNGKETDNETGLQDYGERIYNSSIAKFLSADPLIVKGKQYPWYSPYHFAGNKPIHCIDLDGLEEYCVVSWYNTELSRGVTLITLVKVDGPLIVKYYKREWSNNNIPNQGVTLIKEGFTDTYQGESREANPWRTEREKERANQLIHTNISAVSFSDPNDPTILPIPSPPPPTIPFNGRIMRRGESLNISNQTIGWVSTSPISGGTDASAKSGTLTKEGKRTLNKLAASINSMEDISKVTITSNFTVGTGVTNDEFNFANISNKQVNKAAVDYLKSKLTNREIEVTGNSTTTKSDTNRDNSTAVKVE
jgi:RHS repeat-associated protein